jgi:predicted nuclease with TOPRIM domain
MITIEQLEAEAQQIRSELQSLEGDNAHLRGRICRLESGLRSIAECVKSTRESIEYFSTESLRAILYGVEVTAKESLDGE